MAWTYKSRGKCCRTLGGVQSSQHSSNHLIRAVFDECAEWRWSREAHGVAHRYRVLIRSIRDTTLYRTFSVSGCTKVYSEMIFSCSHGGARLRLLHCWTSGPCRQWPQSVLTGPLRARLRDRPRCWAHVSWPSMQQQQEAKHSPNSVEAKFWCCIHFHFQPLLNLFLFNSAVPRLLLLWRQRWIIKLKLKLVICDVLCLTHNVTLIPKLRWFFLFSLWWQESSENWILPPVGWINKSNISVCHPSSFVTLNFWRNLKWRGWITGPDIHIFSFSFLFLFFLAPSPRLKRFLFKAVSLRRCRGATLRYPVTATRTNGGTLSF